jgi:hypothetical protein
MGGACRWSGILAYLPRPVLFFFFEPVVFFFVPPVLFFFVAPALFRGADPYWTFAVPEAAISGLSSKSASACSLSELTTTLPRTLPFHMKSPQSWDATSVNLQVGDPAEPTGHFISTFLTGKWIPQPFSAAPGQNRRLSSRHKPYAHENPLVSSLGDCHCFFARSCDLLSDDGAGRKPQAIDEAIA